MHSPNRVDTISTEKCLRKIFNLSILGNNIKIKALFSQQGVYDREMAFIHSPKVQQMKYTNLQYVFFF